MTRERRVAAIIGLLCASLFMCGLSLIPRVDQPITAVAVFGFIWLITSVLAKGYALLTGKVQAPLTAISLVSWGIALGLVVAGASGRPIATKAVDPLLVFCGGAGIFGLPLTDGFIAILKFLEKMDW